MEKRKQNHLGRNKSRPYRCFGQQKCCLPLNRFYFASPLVSSRWKLPNLNGVLIDSIRFSFLYSEYKAKVIHIYLYWKGQLDASSNHPG